MTALENRMVIGDYYRDQRPTYERDPDEIYDRLKQEELDDAMEGKETTTSDSDPAGMDEGN